MDIFKRLIISAVVGVFGGYGLMLAVASISEQYGVAGPGYWRCFWFMLFIYSAVYVTRIGLQLDDEISRWAKIGRR